MSRVTVEILYTPGCPHWEAVSRRIRELADGDGIPVAVTQRCLDETGAAVTPRFRGSPTVLVEGLDADAGAATLPAATGFG
jgi:hypothetical protein